MRRTRAQMVIQTVHDELDRIHPNFRFEVVEAGVRKDHDWWYVPVIASSSGGSEPTHEMLVNAYANIEEKLQRERKLNVLFVPATQKLAG